jgi:hypothetical protein
MFSILPEAALDANENPSKESEIAIWSAPRHHLLRR